MKADKNTLKKAVAEVLEGAPATQVARKYSIDRDTLNSYATRYRLEGEKAFEPHHYSMEEKKELINRHIDKGVSTSMLAVDTGIPETTIKRWVDSYKKDGEDGLLGIRHSRRNQKIMMEEELRMTHAVISDTFKFFDKQGKVWGQEIRQFFEDNKAFQNPIFATYMVNLYHNYRILIEDGAGIIKPGQEYRFTEEEYCSAAVLAWMQIMTISDAMEQRREAEKLLKDPYVILFTKAFGEMMPDLAANNHRDLSIQ